jgi:hypothetical protein
VAQPAHANRRGGAARQGSPVTLVQRGQRREHEDGEGRSSSKKDGGTLTNGGQALMRWQMGRHGGVSSRAAARGMVTGSCSTGVSREVREADQLKKKRGIESAHWKRMARQGWWLSGPILTRGGGPDARALSGRGRGFKEGGGGVLGQPEFGGERKGVTGRPWWHL